MKRTKSTLKLGTISEGTLRNEDLIPAFLDAAEGLRLTREERATVRNIRRESEQEGYYEGADTYRDASADVDTLSDILNAHCPDLTYFGPLEGDGACFGCWTDNDAIESMKHDGDIYQCAELSNDIRARYQLVVTDHGNETLYRRAGNRWIEVWSVV
jgi:hypothetical protein